MVNYKLTPKPGSQSMISQDFAYWMVGKSGGLHQLPSPENLVTENQWLEDDVWFYGPFLFSGGNLLLVLGRVKLLKKYC